ncbi:hypothetical protein XU18_0648 [Perkinsela sp. CCAP 1560/4]|nr:hypothetical protein XU18_0648 [Perkinsela sp. CCAP 1560/4]|eukprot:KNH09053.1 hypothetical protein XU18_0648 [Perkinsela sp. CCAP 1560/4]
MIAKSHIWEGFQRYVFYGIGVAKPKDQESSLSVSSRLLTRSSAMVGFFLPHYKKHIPSAIDHLVQLTHRKEIFPQVDLSTTFNCLEDIPSGVEHLYSKQSCGKVIVRLV